LHKEAVGNQVRYRADRDCPIFTELAGIFRKTSGLADVLRDSLAPLQNKIDLAFIFGSVAQGKERQTSDVDVLVIGEASLVDLVTAFAGGHERLGREINPVAMKSDDFVMKYATGERFVTRVMQEAKLFLIGDHDDLGKLVEDRTAEAPHD
jgi:predicted nucleotidyltransferase